MNGLGKSCSAQSFGWERLRVFLAVAERGSLSAAATHLGISQPTASRQIQSLEAELDVQLFARASRKMLLTEAGLTLLEPAREMARAAERFALLAAGRETSLAGVVRITASQVVATYLLPSMLVRLRQAEPSIELEVVASNATDNLLAREADIAIRMYRPTQQEVVTTHIRDLEIGAFAAHSYLRRRGVPTSIDDFQQHDFVGYDRDDLLVRGFRTVGYEVQRRDFPFRTDNQVVFWQAVVAGIGIGFMPCLLGDAEPNVQRILPNLALPMLPVWLTAHAELKTNRRIRRVFDFLVESIRVYTKNRQVQVGN